MESYKRSRLGGLSSALEYYRGMGQQRVSDYQQGIAARNAVNTQRALAANYKYQQKVQDEAGKAAGRSTARTILTTGATTVGGYAATKWVGHAKTAIQNLRNKPDMYEKEFSNGKTYEDYYGDTEVPDDVPDGVDAATFYENRADNFLKGGYLDQNKSNINVDDGPEPEAGAEPEAAEGAGEIEEASEPTSSAAVDYDLTRYDEPSNQELELQTFRENDDFGGRTVFNDDENEYFDNLMNNLGGDEGEEASGMSRLETPARPSTEDLAGADVGEFGEEQQSTISSIMNRLLGNPLGGGESKSAPAEDSGLFTDEAYARGGEQLQSEASDAGRMDDAINTRLPQPSGEDADPSGLFDESKFSTADPEESFRDPSLSEEVSGRFAEPDDDEWQTEHDRIFGDDEAPSAPAESKEGDDVPDNISDFGDAPEAGGEDLAAETAETTAATAGEEAAVEGGLDTAALVGDETAAATAAIPGLDVVTGIIGLGLTAAAAGYSIYSAVEGAQKVKAPKAPEPVIQSQNTIERIGASQSVAGRYVGASADNYFNATQHFSSF